MEDLKFPALKKWLTDVCQLKNYTLQVMQGDASARRYYRVLLLDKSYVAMMAPIERDECKPFVAICKALRDRGLMTPLIIQSDVPRGFLLLEDFGSRQLLSELNKDNVSLLYTNALDALAVLSDCRLVLGWKVPPFTTQFMTQELVLFKDLFLENYLGLELSYPIQKMLLNFFQTIAQHAGNQPQVFMHRDYHSANLMVLPQDQIGILDFQDAFIGPVTYDLVSLLRDCYIAWPEKLVNELALQYLDRLHLSVSADEFLYWFDWMGLQRHMKAVLTFTRKSIRDHNDNYLQHIPRTLNYIRTVSERYPEAKDFHQFLQLRVLEDERVALPCVV